MLERLGARLIGSVLAWDLLLTVLTLHLASLVRAQLDLGAPLPPAAVRLPWPLYPAAALLWAVVFLALTPHRALFTRPLLPALARLGAAVALAAASFAGLLYLSFRDVSRLQFLAFVGLNGLALLAFHLAVRAVARRRRAAVRRALVVGEAAVADRLAAEFDRRPWTGVHVVGYVGDDPAAARLPRLGSLDDTPRLVAEHQIDEVIFALPPERHDQVVRLALRLLQQPVMLHLVPGPLDLTFARTPVETLGGIPLIGLRESALTPSQRLVKRLFDVVVSGALLVLFAPLLLLIALLIKLDSPGPALFVQERVGEHGRRFKMLKFRTMHQDAERRWREVATRDAQGRLIHKLKDDPRVTRVGRLLRRTSLDELPQLINVLRGEMSLVGPRPEMPYIAAEYAPWQWQRFRVPPGITGWWQINGRSDKPMHLHTEDDLYYIQHYSFWLDLQILLRTLRAVWEGRGAY